MLFRPPARPHTDPPRHGRMQLLCPRALALCLLAWPRPARPCDVPVFRYALEHWTPSPYEAVVFHRGALDAQAQQIVARLRSSAVAGEPANLMVRLVDLDEPTDAHVLRLWEQQASATLPRLVLRYAPDGPDGDAVWSAPLEPAAADRLLDSPLRREIRKRLIDGQNGVWLLLESGGAARDQAAARQLEQEVAAARRELALPAPAPGGSLDLQAKGPPGEGISFSIVRLSRTDPAEQVLAAALLHSEWDLPGSGEVMAFPVFGRGRVLYALVGEGITAANLRRANEYVVGACSGLIKDLSPGRDLLMAADWDRAVAVPSFSGAARLLPTGIPQQNAAPSREVAAAGVPGAVLGSLVAALAAAGLGVAALTGAILFRWRQRDGRS